MESLRVSFESLCYMYSITNVVLVHCFGSFVCIMPQQHSFRFCDRYNRTCLHSWKMDYGGHDSAFHDNIIHNDKGGQACINTGGFLPGHGVHW
eukprot:SAG22_NODE_1164_length_5294_cov_3.888162_3_plen_93_part_00